MVQEKRCNRCKITKPRAEFYASGRDKIQAQCVPCSKLTSMEYARSPKGKRSTKKARLKQKFGLPLEDWETMVAAGHDTCWLCKQPSRNRYPLAVDHNHRTGFIRGILCHSCNTGIGMFQENASLMLRAVEYLKASVSLQEAVNGQ